MAAVAASSTRARRAAGVGHSQPRTALPVGTKSAARPASASGVSADAIHSPYCLMFGTTNDSEYALERSPYPDERGDPYSCALITATAIAPAAAPIAYSDA